MTVRANRVRVIARTLASLIVGKVKAEFELFKNRRIVHFQQ